MSQEQEQNQQTRVRRDSNDDPSLISRSSTQSFPPNSSNSYETSVHQVHSTGLHSEPETPPEESFFSRLWKSVSCKNERNKEELKKPSKTSQFVNEDSTDDPEDLHKTIIPHKSSRKSSEHNGTESTRTHRVDRTKEGENPQTKTQTKTQKKDNTKTKRIVHRGNNSTHTNNSDSSQLPPHVTQVVNWHTSNNNGSQNPTGQESSILTSFPSSNSSSSPSFNPHDASHLNGTFPDPSSMPTSPTVVYSPFSSSYGGQPSIIDFSSTSLISPIESLAQNYHLDKALFTVDNLNIAIEVVSRAEKQLEQDQFTDWNNPLVIVLCDWNKNQRNIPSSQELTKALNFLQQQQEEEKWKHPQQQHDFSQHQQHQSLEIDNDDDEKKLQQEKFKKAAFAPLDFGTTATTTTTVAGQTTLSNNNATASSSSSSTQNPSSPASPHSNTIVTEKNPALDSELGDELFQDDN